MGSGDFLQNGGGLSDLVDALHFLDADIEQPDRGLVDAEQCARHARAHQRELDELAGIGADIGANVEHDALALDGRPDGGDGRAVDAFKRLQAELRHDHQRAGIAGRHGGVGAAVSHRLEAKPHARVIAALAQRLARLRVHGDGNFGVDQLRLGGERGMGLELGLDARCCRRPAGNASRDGGRARSRQPE